MNEQTAGFQIRHKHWGVFQCDHSDDPRAPAGHWTLAHPGKGLCRFETRERARGYIDLLCRFFQGMVKSVPKEDFAIEPFDEELARQLGGQTEARYVRDVCLIRDGEKTPDELKARIAELEEEVKRR